MKEPTESVIPSIFRGATESNRVVRNILSTNNVENFLTATQNPDFGGALLGEDQSYALVGTVETDVLDSLRPHMPAGVFFTYFEAHIDPKGGALVTTRLENEFDPLRDLFTKMAQVHYAFTGLPYLYGRAGRNLGQSYHSHPYAVTHLSLDTPKGLGFYTQDGRTRYAQPGRLFHFDGAFHASPNSANKVSLGIHASKKYEIQAF